MAIKEFFIKIKNAESYTSLILGAVVVLVVGILFFSFVKMNRDNKTSSTKVEPTKEAQKTETSSTYTIKTGDTLWSISESTYKDGYKWSELAKENKLSNPDLIYAGNKLTLPKLTSDTKIAQSASTSTYIVQKGDSLWDISVKKYGDGYRWPEIAKVNNLQNPNLIHSGNKLTLPALSKQQLAQTGVSSIIPKAHAEEIKNNSITGKTYKVVENDNLWDISVRAYGDGFRYKEVATANKIQNPGLIYPNNVLNIPR